MPIWALTFIGVFAGLIAGCAVALMSIRIPIFLQREWSAEAHDFLSLPYTPDLGAEAFSKWQFIKGWRFLVIEGICGSIGGYLTWQLGISVEALFLAVLFWTLIAVAVIDFETLYIPDMLVIPLLWSVLIFFALTSPMLLQWHVWGAVAGYCAFRWLPIGRGDAKLCAVAGAWLGLGSLLTYLTIGVAFGVIEGLVYYCLRGKSEPYPYAPSLVAALLATTAMQWM